MLSFSIFFIFYDKISAPKKNFLRTNNIFLSMLYESYGKYYFYNKNIFGKQNDIDSSKLKDMTKKQDSAISWLKYSLLMKVVGAEKEAADGFSEFRNKAKQTGKINGYDILLFSEAFAGDLDKNEVMSALNLVQKLNLGWFQNLAYSLIYRSSGMEEKAEEIVKLAVEEAFSTVRKLLFLSSIILISFIAGIIMIIMGFRREKVFLFFDKDIQYKLEGVYLFETFILWLFTATLLNFLLNNNEYLIGTINSLNPLIRLLIFTTINILPCVSFFHVMKKIRIFSAPREEIYLKPGNLRKNIYYGIGSYLASIPLLFVSALIIIPAESRLEKIIPTPSNPAIELITSSKTSAEWLLIFLLVSLIAPVIEEFLFRGVLQNAFKRKLGTWTAIF